MFREAYLKLKWHDHLFVVASFAVVMSMVLTPVTDFKYGYVAGVALVFIGLHYLNLVLQKAATKIIQEQNLIIRTQRELIDRILSKVHEIPQHGRSASESSGTQVPDEPAR